MSSSFLYHPAFQSLVLPGLLGLLCTLALHRALSGTDRAWGGFGASVGLVLALLWWPGFAWPAAAQAQKVPWIVLLGLLVALAIQMLRRGRAARTGRNPWAVWSALALLVLLGGLAVLAAVSGSLLLAQLALMVAASAGVPVLWAWWRPDTGPRLTAISLIPLLVALLALLAMVASLGWPADGAQQAPGSGADDPYYTPRW
jgi:hypothetical protein